MRYSRKIHNNQTINYLLVKREEIFIHSSLPFLQVFMLLLLLLLLLLLWFSPKQVALAGTQVWWTTEVNIAFSRLEEGYETALKDYYKKQVNQLNTLIHLLLGDLSKGNRQRIMTICTIDVHARDVVAKMVAQKVDNAQAFLWLSQLRHRLEWKQTISEEFIN